jgi:hypothetical protein
MTCSSARRPRHQVRIATCATLAAMLYALPAAAQVPWDSPQLLAPGAPRGLSVLFVDYGLRPDDGTGVMLGYRTREAPAGIGARLATTLPVDSVRVSVGVDVAMPLFEHSATFPLDVLWTTGIGGAWGRYGSVGVPIGFAAGRTLAGDNIWFNPYVSTRVVLETHFGGRRPDEQFAMAVAADVGADVAFDQRRRVVLRGALSLGDRRAVVIGLHAAPW